jgi:mannose-6-phosphate isomerase-like protein (cupin superfamily)
LSQAEEVKLVCSDFTVALDLLKRAGFRLDVIYPADEPHTAVLSGFGRELRLTTKVEAEPPSRELPCFQSEFVLTRSSGASGEGRAGMHYRDLVPTRLGGRYVASHITIESGGPIADWVHFHEIALQLIFVRSGWVKVVYEDQGDPFIMKPGDVVVQPAGIRHRVLEASPGLEVIEITCPALHETWADHAMQLPNGLDPNRRFGSQLFHHHVAERSAWRPLAGGRAQESGIFEATGGLAEVRIMEPSSQDGLCFAAHDGELVFGFVLDGSGQLECQGRAEIQSGDAFVIPPDESWTLSRLSKDFRLLQVLTSRIDRSF